MTATNNWNYNTQGLSDWEKDELCWEFVADSLHSVRHNFSNEHWKELVDAMVWVSDNPNFSSGMEY